MKLHKIYSYVFCSILTCCSHYLRPQETSIQSLPTELVNLIVSYTPTNYNAFHPLLLTSKQLNKILQEYNKKNYVDTFLKKNIKDPFIWAVKHNNDLLVRTLLKKGFDCNTKDSRGFSVLWLATQSSSSQKILKILLAQPSIKIDKDLLHLAAKNGHDALITEIIKLGNININKPNRLDEYADLESRWWPPLFYAIWDCQYKTVELLLSLKKVDVNKLFYYVDKSIPALSLAIQLSDYSIIELLLKHPNININKKSITKGLTPLYIAVDYRRPKVVELLLSQPKIQINREYSLSPLYKAVEQNDVEIVSLLLKHPHIKINTHHVGETLLYKTAKEKKYEIFKLLLAHKKINVNKTNTFELVSTLGFAAKKGDVILVKLLMDHPDINLNIQDMRGETPLYSACQKGHVNIVKLLLQKKADTNKPEFKFQKTPLIEAVLKNNIDIVKALLAYPLIEINKTDISNTNALYKAIFTENIEIIKLFLSHPKIIVNKCTLRAAENDSNLEIRTLFENYSSKKRKFSQIS